MDSLITALENALGPGRTSVELEDIAAHARDSWPAVAKWTEAELTSHLPICVVRPRSAAEAAAVIHTAARFNAGVVPYGAGSGVVGAAIPSRPAISLDTRELNKVVEIDVENWLVRAGAGTLGSDVEQQLNARGFTLGHYPQSLFVSSVGGWVATCATGTFSSKYGGIEDILYSLEVVMPGGEIIQTRDAARSSAGPRLCELFIGSEGAFGVITQVTLKMVPLPEVRRFRGWAVPTVHDGLRAVRELYRSHLVPSLIRLYEEQEASVLYQAAGLQVNTPLLLTCVEGSAALAEAQQKQLLEICARHGGKDLGEEIGLIWEKNRYHAEWLEQGNAAAGQMADAIDVSANWKTLPELYDRMIVALRPICSRVWAHYSHFTAHGGSIYFIVFIDAPGRAAAREQYARVWQTAIETVHAVGGSMAHHHGVGLLRQPYLARELGGEMEILKRIKHALDPGGMMNPGKWAL
jgi:alkyldihydroxyacetonephosphate synthase